MIRVCVLGLVGLLVVWGIVTRTYVNARVESDPVRALAFNRHNADALVAVAQQRLDAAFEGGVIAPKATTSALGGVVLSNEPPGKAELGLSEWAKVANGAARLNIKAPAPQLGTLTKAERAQRDGLSDDDRRVTVEIAALARAALVANPVSASAYRILGQLASMDGDDVAGERLMEEAVRRSIRDSVAVYWLARRAFDKGDAARVTSYVDMALQSRPQLMAAMVPLLVAVSDLDGGTDRIAKMLALDPPYRRVLIGALSSNLKEPRTFLALLLQLKTSAHPPTDAEIKACLDVLIAQKLYRVAYNAWLEFLPDDQLRATGHLFNGRFEFPLSGLAFDWKLDTRSGAVADIVRLGGADNAQGLLIEFNTGQIDFPGVSQTLQVRPGAYVITGRYKGTLVGRRGLKWTVSCLDMPMAKLGESDVVLGVAHNWQTFSFGVTVPQTGCEGQELRLNLDARSASERMISGAVTFADLAMASVAQTTPASKLTGARGASATQQQ